MKPEAVRKLVGGYAMGTLTGEERRALLEAALSDQQLFDELAREQPLKDLLDDPLARRRLLDFLEARRAWWRRPATWALAGGLAAAAVLVAIFVRPPATPPKPEPVLMAKREPAPVAAPVPGAPPPTAKARAKDKAPAGARSRPRFGAETEQSRDREAAAESKAEMAEAQPMMDALRQPPAAGLAVSARLVAGPTPVPYSLLRADAEGSYTEAGAGTVFAREDRVRVAFAPQESGRLVVTSGASKTVLLDVTVAAGTTTDLDVPPPDSVLLVTFTATGQSSGTPFKIQIRRE
jgi:hypothetical protein